MREKQLIVFEGLNGAGKTTIAQMLAKDIGAVYLESPPANLSQLRSAIDDNSSLQTRCVYYLLGNLFISDQIRKIKKGKIVICDRFIHSTLSVHKLLGIDLGFNLDLLDLVKPDINLFFYLSQEKERLSRINGRGKITKYDILQENADFRKKYIDYFIALGNFIFVDTSFETPEETLMKVKRIINNGR